ncbi:hypothetical protein P378_11030 [Desulforamulus profundi]|uniref:GGDEF domain-containing protein n=1 Tax=Desulforamulus profundi TaxID=1383067 RepID=A0A2C6M7Y4_9FIRM|nr:hypothetical protein P378_11030 [Desulforamulus profundi]
MVIIDIDNFKLYSDTYGHEQGNILLKKLADYLISILGREVFIARYGGEEFIILLFGMDRDDAKEMADRIVSGVGSHHFTNGPITISAGVASVSGQCTEVTKLIEKADEALYAAKKSGKNRAVLYKEIQPV